MTVYRTVSQCTYNMDPGNKKNTKRLFKGRYSACGWASGADLLWSHVSTVLDRTLDEMIVAGVCSEGEIAEAVGRHSLRWPIPTPLLSTIFRFAVEFQQNVAQPNEETQEYLQLIRKFPLPCASYSVFHDGRQHFYFDALPEHVLKLREAVLFWINETTNDFCCRGLNRRKLGPQTLSALRFICDNKNAGQTVTLEAFYSKVWQKEPASFDKMVGSVEVEMSKLNTFALKQFEHRTDISAIVTRVHDGYKISKEAPNECCIIRATDPTVAT